MHETKIEPKRYSILHILYASPTADRIGGYILYSAAVRGRATLAGDTVQQYSSIPKDARHATGPGVFTSLYMQYSTYSTNPLQTESLNVSP